MARATIPTGGWTPTASRHVQAGQARRDMLSAQVAGWSDG
jgi:hypothetical protein